MEENSYSIFVDISVLLDYCTPYTEHHQYATAVLNQLHENESEVVICKEAGKALTKCISSQQKLFTFLFEEASRCISEFSRPETIFKGNVLNRDTLGNFLPKAIDNSYNIQSLRRYLEDVGIDKFRESIHDFQRVNHRQQQRLETSIISDRYGIGGADTLYLELAIQKRSNHEIQVQSAMSGVYWSSRNENKLLIRHSHPLFQGRDDFRDDLNGEFDVDFVSPKAAVDS